MVDFWSTNYYASVSAKRCSGCGTCVERCQVNAVSIDDGLGVSSVNLGRCIGCGNCVVYCPSEAMSLLKKEKEIGSSRQFGRSLRHHYGQQEGEIKQDKGCGQTDAQENEHLLLLFEFSEFRW